MDIKSRLSTCKIIPNKSSILKKAESLHYESSQAERLCSCSTFHLLLFRSDNTGNEIPYSTIISGNIMVADKQC